LPDYGADIQEELEDSEHPVIDEATHRKAHTDPEQLERLAKRVIRSVQTEAKKFKYKDSVYTLADPTSDDMSDMARPHILTVWDNEIIDGTYSRESGDTVADAALEVLPSLEGDQTLVDDLFVDCETTIQAKGEATFNLDTEFKETPKFVYTPNGFLTGLGVTQKSLDSLAHGSEPDGR